MKIIDVPPQLLALLNRTVVDTAWPRPEPIQHHLPPVPSMTMTMLPPSLQAAVDDIVLRMQCPPEYVAAPLICALGTVIGTSIRVRPKQRDDWSVTANLWCGVVGPPGRLKSPAISAALRPLYHLDSLLQQAYEQAFSAYEVQALQYEAQEKALKDELREALNPSKKKAAQPPRAPLVIQNDLLTLRANAPKEPARTRCFTNDATLEALGVILADNPKGLLVNQDELMGLLAGFEKPGREGERQGYLTGWNGDSPMHVDRISRDHIYVNPFCLSVLGGIQPDRLARYMAENLNTIGNDGLLQRFQLLVYPDDPVNPLVIDQAPNQVALDDLNKLFTKIFHGHSTFGAEVDPNSNKPYFRFDEAAQPMVYAWLQALDEKARDQDNTLMADHLAKYRKLVPALALIFHIVEIAAGTVPPGTRIPPATLQLALGWADHLEQHARRLFSISTDSRIQAAATLAKRIKAGKLQDGFTQRDILRHDWSALKDLEVIRAACDELEVAGWIRRIQKDGGKKVGRPALAAYEINPEVLT